MTENSSTVGRAAIDAYLDSVELALIEADAPRIDRLQVLQDLEAQIADMLAQQPLPLTEESVRAVVEKLEPPSHFAATYGNSKQPASPTPKAAPSRFPQMPRVPWPSISAASCAVLVVTFLLMMFAAASNAHGPVELFSFLVVVSLFTTPIALWMAYRQLRAYPDMAGRDFVAKSITICAALALALLMLFGAAMTQGFILMALGVAAFIYIEYVLIRRLWRHLAETLPSQSSSSTPRETNGNGASPPVTSASPMPAM
jgi:hypothetical protein